MEITLDVSKMLEELEKVDPAPFSERERFEVCEEIADGLWRIRERSYRLALKWQDIVEEAKVLQKRRERQLILVKG